MPTNFLSSVKQFILFILHLFLTLLFGFITWAFWGLYRDELLAHQYQQEGKLVTVTMTDVSMKKQQWKDHLGNVEYLSFVYETRPYTVRYVESPGFVNEGEKVQLLYDARLDAFRQPEKEQDYAVVNKSRLIEWTSVSLFSGEHKLLLSCLLLSIAFFFLLSGLVARLPGLHFLRSVNGFVFTILLFIGVVYLTYDALVYYRYYHHIKESGERAQALVLDKERYQLTRNTRTDNFPLYGYLARVKFRNAEREIPISEDDYDTVAKGSALDVYYDVAEDDMMAKDYPINFWVFVFVGLVWLLFIVSIQKWVGEMRNKGRRVN